MFGPGVIHERLGIRTIVDLDPVNTGTEDDDDGHEREEAGEEDRKQSDDMRFGTDSRERRDPELVGEHRKATDKEQVEQADSQGGETHEHAEVAIEGSGRRRVHWLAHQDLFPPYGQKHTDQDSRKFYYEPPT